MELLKKDIVVFDYDFETDITTPFGKQLLSEGKTEFVPREKLEELFSELMKLTDELEENENNGYKEVYDELKCNIRRLFKPLVK